MPNPSKTDDSSTGDNHSCTIPLGTQTGTTVSNGGYACFPNDDASTPTLHQCTLGKWVDKGTDCTEPVNGGDGSSANSGNPKGT